MSARFYMICLEWVNFHYCSLNVHVNSVPVCTFVVFFWFWHAQVCFSFFFFLLFLVRCILLSLLWRNKLTNDGNGNNFHGNTAGVRSKCAVNTAGTVIEFRLVAIRILFTLRFFHCDFLPFATLLLCSQYTLFCWRQQNGWYTCNVMTTEVLFLRRCVGRVLNIAGMGRGCKQISDTVQDSISQLCLQHQGA